jgi:osmotically-inducible protein OsmY
MKGGWGILSPDRLPAIRSIHRSAVVFRTTSTLIYSGSGTMVSRTAMGDRDLLKTVNQRLSRMGGGTEAELFASVQNGTVILTGMLQYESQRQPIVRAVSNIPGVHRVIDQLQVGLKQGY